MLHNERHFVRTAEAHIRVLCHVSFDALATDAVLRDDMDAKLCDILSAARSVRARGVMLSAEQSRDALSQTGVADHGVDELMQNLAVLDRLIGQYASGLREIDPGFDQSAAETLKSQEAAHSESSSGPVAPESAQDDMQDNILRAQRAAHVLAPLVTMAHHHDQSALCALMTLSAEQTRLDDDAAPELSSKPAGDEKVTPCDPEPSVNIETLMLPLTNALLAAAHSRNIPMSVSYALDDMDMPKHHARPMLGALIAGGVQMLSAMEKRATETPQLTQTVQIELTGRKAAPRFGQKSDVDFALDMAVPHLNMARLKPDVLSLKNDAFEALSSIGANVAIRPISGADEHGAGRAGVMLSLHYSQKTAAAAAPEIKPDLHRTEALDLRDQFEEALA